MAKHEREKEAMAGEICQLEARVAIMLKDQEQQRLSNGGISCHSGGSFDASGRENDRPVSQTSLSERDIQRLRPLIRTAMTNVKQDMLALVS